jgi:hypothetical protein
MGTRTKTMIVAAALVSACSTPVDGTTVPQATTVTTAVSSPSTMEVTEATLDTLATGLPRASRYGFLEVEIIRAELGNVEPRTYQRDAERSERTFAFLTMKVVNRSETDYANWPPSPYGLLVSGEPIGAPVMIDGRPHIGLPNLSSADVVMAFEVPHGAAFEDMAFTVAEPDRIPMRLPLTGDVPAQPEPVPVAVVGAGPAQGAGVGCRQNVDVTVLGGRSSIDLLEGDFPTAYGSRRARIGDRFLSIDLRVLNHGGSRCGGGATNFSNSDVRLLVDGVPREPVGWVNAAIGVESAAYFTFDFVYPDDATELELRVGSTDNTAFTTSVPVS